MRLLIAGILLTTLVLPIVRADDTAAAISVLRKVQPGAVDSAAARSAVQQLRTAGPSALLPLLHGFRDASPLAGNWLRNAFEQIADSETEAGRKLPQQELEAFVLDQQQSRDLMYLSVSYLCIMAYKINKGIHLLNDNHELLATIFEPKVIVDTM